MQLANLRRYFFVVRTFRNGWELIPSHRQGRPCGRAVLWSGTPLQHPPREGGLVGTILELWLDQCYTADGFYEPADGDVIIDAGAHVGLFACWAARRNPSARVVAIEPCADNYECPSFFIKSSACSSVIPACPIGIVEFRYAISVMPTISIARPPLRIFLSISIII